MPALADIPPPPKLPKQLWVVAIAAWTAAGQPRQRVQIPFRWSGHPFPLIVEPIHNSLHVSYADRQGCIGSRRIPKPKS